MSKRYGNCQKKHAEVTIKSVIRGWAKERESFAEQFEAIDNRGACNWIGCDN